MTVCTVPLKKARQRPLTGAADGGVGRGILGEAEVREREAATINEERFGANEGHGAPPPTTNNRRNGHELVVLDDALSELARIGAEGVSGVRVVSAEVEGRQDVRLAVDVKCGKLPSEPRPVSELVQEMCDGAKANIGKHLPGREDTRVNVTVASVCRPKGSLRERGRGLWGTGVGFLKGELGPWIVPLLVLAFGVCVLWAITRFVNDKDTTVGDVVLVLLLVSPILIYAIVTGKLTELKGPGGVEAKFSAQAAMPVATTASHDSVSIDEVLTVTADAGQRQLGKRVQRFTEIQPIVMTVTIGADSFSEGDEGEHIRGLRAYVAQLPRPPYALPANITSNGGRPRVASRHEHRPQGTMCPLRGSTRVSGSAERRQRSDGGTSRPPSFASGVAATWKPSLSREEVEIDG